MQPSKRQAKVLEVWLKEQVNVLLSAVAGSGKTSTLFLLLKSLKKKTLFLAFNKSIQVEIEKKMEKMGISHGKSMTLHSLGLLSIRYSLPNQKIKIENGKNWRLMKELQIACKTLYNKLPNYEEKQKLNFTLMDLNDMSRVYLTNDFKTLISILTNMDKNPYKFEYLEPLWTKLLEIREAEYNSDKSIINIDFTDMIYLPASRDFIIPVDPKILMIDECQDLSTMQHKMIDNLIKQGHVKKWIAVGDRNQSIYGFSGAHSGSFDLFKDKDNVVELPLDICYRCPVDVVESANKVYNIMQPFKQHTGIVETLGADIETIIAKVREYPESMIICRNEGPLITMYFDLITRDIPCKLVGEDILSSLIRFLSPKQNLSIASATDSLSNEFIKLSTNQKTEEGRIKFYVFKENFENYMKLVNNFDLEDNRKIKDIIEKVKAMFEGSTDSISLCSIHKSKGLEADTVFILNESLIPSKFAKSKEQLTQEENLRYVARTRAKENMFFIEIQD